MTTRFKKPEEPIHKDNLDRAADWHMMKIGIQTLEESRDSLKKQENLTREEEGRLRSITKMIDQINNNIQTVEDSMLENIDTSIESSN